MLSFYKLDRIDLGEKTLTGHEVYKNAQYWHQERKQKIVYKKNKNNNPLLSQFEVSFSHLANLFLAPHLTPSQALVKNEHSIAGLASEFFCYTAARREDKGQNFYELKDSKNSFLLKKKVIQHMEEIPVYFFNEYPQGFFSILWDARKKKKIAFDMQSLASVLTTSYTLEEDDLHKGNFGFYIVEREGKKTIVFFKIDNDLMLSDSVMSRCGSRLLNLGHGDHAFDITERDILSFPKLYDSQNYYWPTTSRYLVNPFDDKIYSDAEDMDAFLAVAIDKEFIQAKWLNFYKHILIPPLLISDALSQGMDITKPEDRAQLQMIMHSVIGRQARLSAVLFSLPAFRNFIQSLDKKAQDGLIKEIFLGLDNKVLEGEIREKLLNHQTLCKETFVEGDTPLHVAIKLGDYRYHETLASFSSFLNQPNSRGEKPIDIAAAKIGRAFAAKSLEDVRKNPFLICQSLLRAGADKPPHYKKIKNSIENYSYKNTYIDKAKSIANYKNLNELFREIGEDHRFSLKMKKEISLDVFKSFISYSSLESQSKRAILFNIKKALNGTPKEQPAPELQYIRQLRSRLWIVRKIRGLLGGTGTQVAFNQLIDKELNAFPNFFTASTEERKDIPVPVQSKKNSTCKN